LGESDIKPVAKSDPLERALRRMKFQHFKDTFGESDFYTVESDTSFHLAHVFKPLIQQERRDPDVCFGELHHELFGSDGGGPIDTTVLASLMDELGCVNKLDLTDDCGGMDSAPSAPKVSVVQIVEKSLTTLYRRVLVTVHNVLYSMHSSYTPGP
jgi:hypothetical protein